MSVDVLYYRGQHVDFVSRWLARGLITTAKTRTPDLMDVALRSIKSSGPGCPTISDCRYNPTKSGAVTVLPNSINERRDAAADTSIDVRLTKTLMQRSGRDEP